MKFVLITKQGLTDQQVNVTSKAFFDRDYEEVLETVDIEVLKNTIKVPPKSINIILKGRYLTEILIKTITPCYLRGTQITINGIDFPTCHSNPQYFYQWQDKVPSSLPDYLKQAYKEFNLRGDLYQDLVEWNQARIAKAKEKSQFKWSFAEEFYKQLFKAFAPQHIIVQSPNEKTFYEATAELAFEQVVKPEPALSVEEQMYLDLAELKHYNRAFGLQDTSVLVGMHHRTTPHGSTDEPILVSSNDIEQAKSSLSFQIHDNRELEGYVNDNGFKVIQWNSTKSSLVTLHNKERENIETLKWFLSQPKEAQEQFLMPGWHFCPVCGQLYHELDGCGEPAIEETTAIVDNNGVKTIRHIEAKEAVWHVEPIDFVPYNDETHDNDLEEDYSL